MEERIDRHLQKEQQEQKKIARSAFKKPRRKGCRLPHEYLTKKELNDLNGEVKVMNMNKPVSFKVFKTWPIDIQKQYLEGLVEKYKVTAKQVSKMLGVATNTLFRHIKKSKYSSPFGGNGKHSDFDQTKWDKFCQNGAEETNQKLTPEEIIEHVESGLVPCEEAINMIETNQDLSKGKFVDISEKIQECNLDFQMTHFLIQDLKSWDELSEFVSAVKLPFNNTVEIKVQRRYL